MKFLLTLKFCLRVAGIIKFNLLANNAGGKFVVMTSWGFRVVLVCMGMRVNMQQLDHFRELF